MTDLEKESKSIFPDWMVSIASAVAHFIAEKLGNPNPAINSKEFVEKMSTKK